MQIRNGITIICTLALGASQMLLPALADTKQEDVLTKKPQQPWQLEQIKKLPPDVVMDSASSQPGATKSLEKFPGSAADWSGSHFNFRK